MKKILYIFIMLIILNIALCSNENEILSINSDNLNYKELISFYADDIDSETSATVKTDDKNKPLFAVNIAHGVLGAIAYADMIALCIIGNIMLTRTYDEADSATSASSRISGSSDYNALKISHRVLTITTYTLMGTSLLMSFVTLGIKIHKKMPVNIPHFISAVITTALYLLEFVSVGITAWAYSTRNPYASYIGLFHGIYSYVLLASFTVTLITLPIGWNNRKVIGKTN